ncbi:MAG: type IVB secretion system protein IcmH/DotU [Gammaproteobacteria bacterium]|nr:type IVB secretion system protein IcmH/DotU [Gammaproteobacteria bacterium]
MKQNKLLELCHPIFQLTAELRRGERGAELTEAYAGQIKLAMEELERNAVEEQIEAFSMQKMKYAIAAFIDEAILSSAWPYRKKWMGKPLQLQYFGEHSAGEGFFKQLAELRQMGTQHVDILEVYFICLQLGFEGMYRLQGLEKLLGLQVDLRSQIEMVYGVITPQLASEAVPEQSIILKVGKKLPFWAMTSVTAALVLGLYASYNVAVNHKAVTAAAVTNISKTKLLQKYLGDESHV